MKYTSQLMKYTLQFAKCEAIIRSLLREVFFTSYILEFYLLQMLCPHVTVFFVCHCIYFGMFYVSVVKSFDLVNILIRK